MAKLARVQQIVLPILRASPELSGVTASSWVPDIDYRTYPILNIKRMGGGRDAKRPFAFGLAVIEMTVYAKEGLPETEEIYENALEALYEAVQRQTTTPAGYLHSMRETMGTTSFQSPYADSWRVQGLIQLGMRPPRTKP
jgi:hypothetical protein